MNSDHCVIVGGSHAAAQLASSLRTEGWEGKISIIGDEPHAPYHRPPLSKAYLSGAKTADEILIRPKTFYEKQNIDLVLGQRVTSIDRENKSVQLSDGTTIPYTKLALTTGAKVRKINLPGVDKNGVFYLRDLNDIDQIKQFVGAGKSAVIIGGGYIGLETAAALRKLEMNVTVLEALPRVLQRVTAPEVSAFYARVHAEEGVNIITDAAAQSIEGDENVSGVVCADGTAINADLVIIGVGVIPDIELAEQAGLTIDNGLLVDEFARTSDHDIVAAGDCTMHHNPIYDRMLRLESVQNATDQSRTAAKALCGKLETYRALPWFWSDQYDLKLQIAGLSQGFDQVVVRGSTETGRKFACFYFQEGKLIAVDAVNSPKEFMTTKRALAEGKTATAEQIADESKEMKEIFNF